MWHQALLTLLHSWRSRQNVRANRTNDVILLDASIRPRVQDLQPGISATRRTTSDCQIQSPRNPLQTGWTNMSVAVTFVSGCGKYTYSWAFLNVFQLSMPIYMYTRTRTHAQGCTKPGHRVVKSTNFVRRLMTLVSPQDETDFTSPIWHLKFWCGS
jgi:hypothetical protein